MDNKGVHIQVINSILNYAEEKWGTSAKITLLKLSQINVEDLEGLQYYLGRDYFFIMLDIVKNEFNQEKCFHDMGLFCGAAVTRESVYLHPILSEGNPLGFLKKAEKVLQIFFPDLEIKIVQTKTNQFYLSLPSYKHTLLLPLIHGFLDAIIVNFSKKGKIKINRKPRMHSGNLLSYKIRYQNILKVAENLIFSTIIFTILTTLTVFLYLLKTPWFYLAPMTIMGYFTLTYPYHVFVANKKKSYYQSLIKELNQHEKRMLSLDEEYSHEIYRLKNSINQLTALGNSILQEESIEAIVDKLIYDALLLLGSERAIIFFYDKERHQLYATDKFKKKTEIRFFADDGIAGKIGKLKKPIIINDPYSNPFFSKHIDKEQSVMTKNLIGAPIIDSQGDLIGVMEVSNKLENNFYTEIDLNILTSICNYGALAMQKYLHMQKRIKIEHKRIMDKISAYFSTPGFMSFIHNHHVPDFKGKHEMQKKLKHFLYIFSYSTDSHLQIKMNDFQINNIEKEVGITLHRLSSHIESLDEIMLKKSLKILIKNSRQVANFNNKPFNAHIFFTDEVLVPQEIRKKYRLTAPINEWNSRTSNEDAHFIDYIQKIYPYMDNDIEEIKKYVSYLPKLIFRDQSGGLDKNLEEEIFYPFFSTMDHHYGIGLNLLSKLITQNNGILYFHNQEDQGVEITLLFYQQQLLKSWETNIYL